MWKELNNVFAHSSKWVSVNIQFQAPDFSQDSVSIEKKKSGCVFLLVLFHRYLHFNPAILTHVKFLSGSILLFRGEGREICVMAGKQDVFYLRDVQFYYYKGRAATEFISVHGIFPPCDYTVGAPRVPLLENIYSADSKPLKS